MLISSVIIFVVLGSGDSVSSSCSSHCEVFVDAGEEVTTWNTTDYNGSCFSSCCSCCCCCHN